MNYRDRFYGAYVSSGQTNKAGLVANPETMFRSSAPYIQHVIHAHVPKNKGLRILDLGCGHGPYLYYLKKLGYTNCAGVDISQEQVDLAKSIGIPEIEQGTIEDFLAKQNGAVDVIFLMDILEHLTRDELLALLDKIFAKLSPSGLLIIHVPNGEGIFGQRIRYGDLTHELCFTPNSMSQLMRTVGFKQVSSFEDKPLLYSPTSVVRRILWETLTIPFRLLLLTESGVTNAVLSQNMLVVAKK